MENSNRHNAPEYLPTPWRIPGDEKSYDKNILLLNAVIRNDLSTVKNLLECGFDVNTQGAYGETPLHIAVSNTNHEMLNLLLDAGAKTHHLAYETPHSLGLSPLHLAIASHDVVSAQTMIDRQGLNAFSLKSLEELVLLQLNEYVEKSFSAKNVEDFLIMNVMADHSILLVQKTGTLLRIFENQPNDPTHDVLSVINGLKAFANFQTHAAIQAHLLKTAQSIENIDQNYDAYIKAKLLFHVIPIDGVHEISYKSPFSEQEIHHFIKVDGFTLHPILSHVAHTMAQYIDQPLSLKEKALWPQVYSDIQFANDYATARGLFSTAYDFFSAYEQGQTVLLTTGWEGHAVNVILNKPLDLLLIANNGQRNDQTHSGVTIFKVNHPEAISADLIHDILINKEQIDLEFNLSMKLGLEKIGAMSEPDQTVGNCAWQSAESAVEALLYVHLLESGHLHHKAKMLAQSFYHDWDTFQSYITVKEYFEGDGFTLSTDLAKSLIESHLFTIQAKDLKTLEADPIGEILLDVYLNDYHGNLNEINFDFDPFEKHIGHESATKTIEDFSQEMPPESNGISFEHQARPLSLKDVIALDEDNLEHALNAFDSPPDIEKPDAHQTPLLVEASDVYTQAPQWPSLESPPFDPVF